MGRKNSWIQWLPCWRPLSASLTIEIAAPKDIEGQAPQCDGSAAPYAIGGALRKKLDQQACELAEVRTHLADTLEQQAATSEVLQVISSSPGNLELAFQAMLKNATRVCGAKFGVLFRYEGGFFHPAALLDVPPAFAEFLKRQGSFSPKPDRLFGRLCTAKVVIHVVDRAAQPYSSPSARWRTIFYSGADAQRERIGRKGSVFTVPPARGPIANQLVFKRSHGLRPRQSARSRTLRMRNVSPHVDHARFGFTRASTLSNACQANDKLDQLPSQTHSLGPRTQCQHCFVSVRAGFGSSEAFLH
jgi:hypothetical protein